MPGTLLRAVSHKTATVYHGCSPMYLFSMPLRQQCEQASMPSIQDTTAYHNHRSQTEALSAQLYSQSLEPVVKDRLRLYLPMKMWA